jgi:D-3-phosphoglycerate dehydrogenase
MKRGEWKKKSLIGCRIRGKILGIVGCGKIGREIANLGSALKMKVIVSDPCIQDENVTLVSLDELLKTSDFITVNCPLTGATRDLIGKEEIAKMKDGTFMVNTARGGIIDEKALLEAVNAGKVHVALDVFSTKTPFEDEVTKSLIQSERVIATPHSIGQSHEAIEEKGEGVIKAIKGHINRQI